MDDVRRVRLGGAARDAPVDEEDLAERPDHDVLGLDVAMDDVARVRELQGGEELKDDAAAGLERVVLVRGDVTGGEALDDDAERLALDPAHREVRLARVVDA